MDSIAVDLERSMETWREADDDHYHGPWFGGSRASGGGPGRGSTLEARRADMVRKVGPENVRRQNVVDKVHTDGGFTASAVGKPAPTDGFQVSPYQERERKFPMGSFTAADHDQFISDNADLLGKPGHFLGGWVYEGEVYLDVSVNVRTEAAAERMARKANQIAAWDVKNGKEIRFREADAKPKSGKPNRPPDVLQSTYDAKSNREFMRLMQEKIDAEKKRLGQ